MCVFVAGFTTLSGDACPQLRYTEGESEALAIAKTYILSKAEMVLGEGRGGRGVVGDVGNTR